MDEQQKEKNVDQAASKTTPLMTQEMAAFLWQYGLYSWGLDVMKKYPNRSWWATFNGKYVNLIGY